MKLTLHKYHGAGNDFLLIDNRKGTIKLTTQQIAQLCHRNYGVGADGLMLLEKHATLDFKMVYYNSNGKQSTMCGNGGRCIVLFAHHLGVIETSTQFMAIDGAHLATINANQTISLHMINVPMVQQFKTHYEVNTGSPHYVTFVPNNNALNVALIGAKVRYSSRYAPDGINVNYVQVLAPNKLAIRTYERGVENETLACGTGVTAAALSYYVYTQQTATKATIKVAALGGKLVVTFNYSATKGFTNIVLTGSAKAVFTVSMEL